MERGLKVIITDDDGLRKEFHLTDSDLRNREILAMWDGLCYYDDSPPKRILYNDKLSHIARKYHLSTVRVSNIISEATKVRASK